MGRESQNFNQWSLIFSMLQRKRLVLTSMEIKLWLWVGPSLLQTHQRSSKWRELIYMMDLTLTSDWFWEILMKPFNKDLMNISIKMQPSSRKRTDLDWTRRLTSNALKTWKQICTKSTFRHYNNSFWSHLNLIKSSPSTKPILNCLWFLPLIHWKLLC